MSDENDYLRGEIRNEIIDGVMDEARFISDGVYRYVGWDEVFYAASPAELLDLVVNAELESRTA